MDYGLCFQFWYHFFGLDHAELSVEIHSVQCAFNAQPVWVRRSPQSNNWALGTVDLPNSLNAHVYIIFRATLTSKYHDVVGLDDLR